jgi:hypothetical protein
MANDNPKRFQPDYRVIAPDTQFQRSPWGHVLRRQRPLDFNYAGYFAGSVRVTSIPAGSHSGTVCFNPPGDLLCCEGSSLRFKTNVEPFREGLDVVQRLRPISFTWKDGGMPDIGLGAEEVAEVAPSLTITNSVGEPEGVKYDRLNIVLINAVKEQQAQIQRQQDEIDALKGLVCQAHPDADVCR